MLYASALLLSACDKQEPIPAYLHIPTIDLSTKTDRSEGSNTHDIVDAWVYVNGKHIGVFELPAKFPVLESGKHKVTVLAGIKRNGQSTQRFIYPFYTAYEQELELIPGQVHSLLPQVQYRENTQFVWLEDAEDQNLSMEKSGSITTVDSMHITADPDLVFDYNGNTEKYSGYAVMDSGYQIFQMSSIQLYDLPRRGAEIYLEFNFNTEVELIAGIYPITGTVVNGIPIVNLFPTDSVWKKAYVSLKEDVNSAEYTGADFRIFFAAQKGPETSAKKIYLDNIKLIHF